MMLLIASLCAWAGVISGAGAGASAASGYNEHLQLRPLPGGYLYAGFNFTSTTSIADYNAHHYRFFPRSLAQILQYTKAEELHLRFAVGRWDDEEWGSRPRNGMREGGNGVELWAWLQSGDHADTGEERWSGLVNSLSGLFCASLNFIDGTKTTRPVLTFVPEGNRETSNQSLTLLHGMLPHEVVCTENLTPFLKLLPCKGKTGISSLLDGHKVFDANWQSMSIDVRSVCDDTNGCAIEIQQTVDMVLDIERAMRPRNDPIPRPLPIEEIECDETKSYHGPDTCYPKRLDYEMAWSLSRVFGQPIQGRCSLAGEGSVFQDVSLDIPYERQVDRVVDSIVDNEDFGELRLRDRRFFTIPEGRQFDLSLPRQTLNESSTLTSHTPSFLATRQMTGYGQERGGMHAQLQNLEAFPRTVVYHESLPWFMRTYMHTLKITGAELEKMYYVPAKDRERGTQLELLLNIPAHSTVDLTYDFDKAILRYTEYPPDANRGFDVPAAIIRILPAGEGRSGDPGTYLRTTSLLLLLPTPDFSMPYNVIILTSTVIALGFGSIFNLLTRRFVLASEVPESPLITKLKTLQAVIAEKVQLLRQNSAKSQGTLKQISRPKTE